MKKKLFSAGLHYSSKQSNKDGRKAPLCIGYTGNGDPVFEHYAPDGKPQLISRHSPEGKSLGVLGADYAIIPPLEEVWLVRDRQGIAVATWYTQVEAEEYCKGKPDLSYKHFREVE